MIDRTTDQSDGLGNGICICCCTLHFFYSLCFYDGLNNGEKYYLFAIIVSPNFYLFVFDRACSYGFGIISVFGNQYLGILVYRLKPQSRLGILVSLPPS